MSARRRTSLLYEHRSAPLLTRSQFLRRAGGHMAVALAVALFALGIGMVIYHVTEGLGWLDAFLNAAMLLGGMGPIHVIATPAGKLWVGAYALFAGLVFIAIAGVVVAPWAHRLLHRLHIDDDAHGANND